MGERADQRPYRDGGAEPIPVAQCDADEKVQRVPERGPLRRRPDQQLPVDRGGAVDATALQPLRVRVADAAQPSSDGGLGPPEPGGDGGRPQLRAVLWVGCSPGPDLSRLRVPAAGRPGA